MSGVAPKLSLLNIRYSYVPYKRFHTLPMLVLIVNLIYLLLWSPKLKVTAHFPCGTTWLSHFDRYVLYWNLCAVQELERKLSLLNYFHIPTKPIHMRRKLMRTLCVTTLSKDTFGVRRDKAFSEFTQCWLRVFCLSSLSIVIRVRLR